MLQEPLSDELVPREDTGRDRVIVVGPELAGQRADVALSRAIASLSRRDIQRLCEQGRVECAGRLLRKSELLRLDDSIVVHGAGRPCATPNARLGLVVRFESRHWIVVAKPPNQPTAPRNSAELDTLANALVAAYPELSDIGYRALEPGLLHRLDNGTSGLLVAARTADGFRAAAAALKQGRWVKRYLALVHGCDLPPAGIIQGQLAADRQRPYRVRLPLGITVTALQPEADWSCTGAREPAAGRGDSLELHATRFLVLGRVGNVTKVEVAVGPAYRHQIRAHFAAAGWPLVNDRIYGSRAEPGLPALRHALHAARVAWSGTEELEGFDVEEPLPEDLRELLLSGTVDAR